MDIDIASKLFPNITTLIVQLLATGVMLCIFKSFYGNQYKTILLNVLITLKEL
ncbi:hypothetical protein SD457_23970 [Coprobacillaceae bacterium CR2/5/TPMF4]|nr:hypothetical protein SD457_23970 [Coprobacillaceae bacterium CR2/5/TPMF4]